MATLILSRESTIPAFAGKNEELWEVEATNTLCEPGTYRVEIVGDQVIQVLVLRKGRFAALNKNAHRLAWNRLGAHIKQQRAA